MHSFSWSDGSLIFSQKKRILSKVTCDFRVVQIAKPKAANACTSITSISVPVFVHLVHPCDSESWIYLRAVQTALPLFTPLKTSISLHLNRARHIPHRFYKWAPPYAHEKPQRKCLFLKIVILSSKQTIVQAHVLDIKFYVHYFYKPHGNRVLVICNSNGRYDSSVTESFREGI